MTIKFSTFKRTLPLFGTAFLLAACANNPVSAVADRFRDNDVKEANVAREDERTAVLALDNELVPDPELANRALDLPAPYVNASWPQPGGEADHTMHHLQAPLQLRRNWSVKTGAPSEKRSPQLAPPVVADGRIFVANARAEVIAFDAKSGRRIWKAIMTPDVSERKKFWQVFQKNNPAEIGFGGGVAYDSGRVFMTSGFGFVAAIDAESGELIWKEKTEAPIRNAPTAANGEVFVVTNTNEILAFDQETGEESWDFQSFEEKARFLAATSPAVSEGIVLAPFSSGEVTALDAENGRQLWSKTIGRSSRMNALSDLNDIAGSPVIDRDRAYAVSHAGQMMAIDMRTGDTIWEQPIGGLQTPWVAGNTLYVLSVENQLVALDRDTGKVAWVAQLPKYKNEKKKKHRLIWNGPVLAGGNLVVASSHGVVALVSPADGSVIRSARFDKDGTLIRPVVANERLYILSANGRLYAFN